jgi:hypothetical protein
MSSAILACLKNGRIEVKCNKVCEVLQKAYGESSMKKKQKKQVLTSGSDGRDDESSGRPSTSIIDENVNNVEKMVINDH